MNPKFDKISNKPENAIFAIVFYPDRIYHAQYLNATRSPRYRYNVTEVRNRVDITVLKGEVYLDGQFLCNFMRLEYRAGRLVEQIREKQRFLRGELFADVRLCPEDPGRTVEGSVKMHFCSYIDAYQVEIWETLEPPPRKSHDIKVLDDMGRNGSITRVRSFSRVLADIDNLHQLELAFRENDIDLPFGYRINDPQSDTAFHGTYQAPLSDQPSAPENTIPTDRYLINFRRGWFFANAHEQVKPVRYRNGLVENFNPDFKPDNIIEMRWIVQRELGGSLVYFHEVTIPPGCVEGTHRHIGSEELYYIYEGEGIAYMGDGDDPANDQYPLKEVDIFAIGKRNIRVLPVKPGSVIYTKSGGIHGIRNPSTTAPLRFVAFGYHTV
jgi:mannose-6-phosphate isomerase-like protein (cupin superfamily)